MKIKKLFQIDMNYTSLLRLFALLGLTLSQLTGCGNTARNVARLELAQIVTYEEQVDKKITAEKDFYKNTSSNIKDRYDKLNPYALSSSIINRSNQAADEMIGQPVKNTTDWDVMKFIESTITDYQTNRMQWNELNLQVEERFNANLVSLRIAKKQLKEVRKKIEKLQQEPTEANQIDELQVFIKGTQEAFKQLQEQQESN